MEALLGISSLRHNAIEFDKIKENDFIPALKKLINKAQTDLEEYYKVTEVSFESVMDKLSEVTEGLDYISSIFYSLYSAHATDELRSVSQEFSALLTDFSNKISMDEKVFEKVKKLFSSQETLDLSDEQKVVLKKTFDSFKRSGALLNDVDKKALQAINKEMSELSLKFSDNILESVNALFLHIENKDELKGLSDNVLAQAIEEAKKRELTGYVFTLQYPSYLPFMKSCEIRNSREKLYKLMSQKARLEKFNNEENIKREVELRIKKAHLLGYENHASYVLEKRMAGNPETVTSFLKNIYEKSYLKAKQEFSKLEELAKNDGVEVFSPWDSSYYAEILKKKVLNFNDEILKPFFSCDEVVDGVFKIAKKLFELDFKEVTDLPTYHEEVRVFEVFEKEKYLGLFYMDLYPRDTKKQGAWMTNFIEQGLFFGEVKRPHVGIVCNFTKPSKNEPSLLTLNEVLTLFHEFGHALHGLLSKCRYRDVSGTSVYWDFVELPSQIMENWVKEKECLEIFAKHYKTGEPISEDLILKIKESNQFLEAMATLRQVSLATLDMNWHTLKEFPEHLDVEKFERESMKDFNLYENTELSSLISYSFGHLFAGGYSSGYYSYKWAEVLDADAFKRFEEEGIFSKKVALDFKTHILEKGGSVDPMSLFESFRGRKPDVDALLTRAGLQ